MVNCGRINCLKCNTNKIPKKNIIYCQSNSKHHKCNKTQGPFHSLYTLNHKGFYSTKSYNRTFNRAPNHSCYNFCNTPVLHLKNPITNKTNTLYPYHNNKKQFRNVEYSRLLNNNYKSKPAWKYGKPYVCIE